MEGDGEKKELEKNVDGKGDTGKNTQTKRKKEGKT
jgi:hypothetical protein